ncbi:cyclic 2,3-diphosphoglycerate synthase [Pseudodesulfovibrio sp. zrk46]|uniref:cyclic 2,3-diphosphoglycerate synthase n=1 Tax=Pseudodesulfovibrio sp. zrk46 TaxID=2725288 RepID=UPI001448DD9E|nr:cyclic 2,3-diphosphoglycerate synthase [Pseudodesulfovibrio sp. zrk46]QJB55787.1 GTPase [Pseudodesulfovibrio sp. zrk46]
MTEKVIIMGAAGRDFHNFNVYFRDNERYDVVCFTATQIPDIDGRKYPAELAGEAYPKGIPIFGDDLLEELILQNGVDLVVFSYSDITHTEVMHKASIATAAGADFMIVGAPYTMIESEKPVVSVCAVRTGCGKSQTSREVVRVLQDMGKRVVTIRHPMPYGDLAKQAVQRFEKYEDFDAHNCTIEEREEYEPVIEMGAVIYAGVDYGAILEEAQKEADIIVWDGGNNDTPFYKPDLNVVVFDPHRAGHEMTYHPGETNMRMCDVAVINKVDSAKPEDVDTVRKNIKKANPNALIIEAESEVAVDDAQAIKGKRVLVVEDGPTLTHGEMQFGAGVIAAQRFGAAEMVDPRPYLVGSLEETFDTYPDIGDVLPAMGYSEQQVRDLEATINGTDCDVVLSATPIDIAGLISVEKPLVRVRYGYKNRMHPTLEGVLRDHFG